MLLPSLQNMRKPEDAYLSSRNQGDGSVHCPWKRVGISDSKSLTYLRLEFYQTATAAEVAEGPYSLPAVIDWLRRPSPGHRAVFIAWWRRWRRCSWCGGACVPTVTLLARSHRQGRCLQQCSFVDFMLISQAKTFREHCVSSKLVIKAKSAWRVGPEAAPPPPDAPCTVRDGM